VTVRSANALPRPLADEVILPMEADSLELDTPAVLVDLDVVEGNILRMQAFADQEGFRLRPHVKSHKSVAVARRQLQAGAMGICVSSASEAAAMAASGAEDVLLAYPLVGSRKMDRLDELAVSGRVTVVTDSEFVTEGYSRYAKSLGTVLPVLVEVDTGMNRVGVDPRSVATLALDVARSDGLRFAGIMTHAGHAHDVASHADIVRVAREEAAIMGAVREELEALGLEVPIVSAGSTITSPYLRGTDGITEIRPGTYVYNDLRTMGRFACTADTIAASMLSTVVSINGDRVTVDAGSKTLTTSRDEVHGYGTVDGFAGAAFTRLSEEHGVFSVAAPSGSIAVGDRVRIRPIHVCVWMDLQPEVYGVRGGKVVERINVDAMRHSL
jgi:D-serine deaminase-like pyridoxal phosphate-dependent protein